jgi:hypothetical protein
MNLWLSSLTNCYHLLYIVFSFYRVYMYMKEYVNMPQWSSFHLILVVTIFSVCNIIMHVIVNISHYSMCMVISACTTVKLISCGSYIDHNCDAFGEISNSYAESCCNLCGVWARQRRQRSLTVNKMAAVRHRRRTSNHLPELQLLTASMLPSCCHYDVWGLSSPPFIYLSA